MKQIFDIEPESFIIGLGNHERMFRNRLHLTDETQDVSIVMPWTISKDMALNKESARAINNQMIRLFAADLKKVVHIGDTESDDPLLCAIDGAKKRGWKLKDTEILMSNLNINETYDKDHKMYTVFISARIGLRNKNL